MSYTNVVTQDAVLEGFTSVARATQAGGPPGSWASASSVKPYYLTKTRSGSSNPQWRKLVKSGSNATTAYSLVAFRMDIAEPGFNILNYEFGTGPSKYVIRETCSGLIGVASPVYYAPGFSGPDTTALLQIYKKIDATANQWKGLAFFAEFADVVHQFGHPAESLLKYATHHIDQKYLSVRSLLRGTLSTKKKRQKLYKMLADSYLEFVFGLAPLISDTKKAAEALARFEYEGDPKNNPALRTRAVGRGSMTYQSPITTTPYSPFGSPLYMSFLYQDSYSCEMKVQYIAGLSTSIKADFGSVRRLADLTGFTPGKIIPAAWEAVPWSWLGDYFSNVGDVLGTIGVNTSKVNWLSKSTVQVDILSRSTRLDVDNMRVRTNNVGKYLGSSGVSSRYVFRKTTMTRTIPSNLGWPSIQWSLPFEDEHLAGKFANLVAVLVQKHGALSGLVSGFLAGSATLFL